MKSAECNYSEKVSRPHSRSDKYPRVAPFMLFMAFIGVEEGIRFLAAKGYIGLNERVLLSLYPVKTVVVGLMLIAFASRYPEMRFRDILKPAHTFISIFAGVFVFVLWINMDWPFATFGSSQGYNPLAVESNTLGNFLVSSRLIGAVAVVPFMEEIFWRSFLIRYSISKDFDKIPVGQFTWGSFLAITFLFGLEHNYYLAGMMAGAVYNLLLYYTKSISQCIMAHAVTNLALGVYVLQTGKWQFW